MRRTHSYFRMSAQMRNWTRRYANNFGSHFVSQLLLPSAVFFSFYHLSFFQRRIMTRLHAIVLMAVRGLREVVDLSKNQSFNSVLNGPRAAIMKVLVIGWVWYRLALGLVSENENVDGMWRSESAWERGENVRVPSSFIPTRLYCKRADKFWFDCLCKLFVSVGVVTDIRRLWFE